MRAVVVVFALGLATATGAAAQGYDWRFLIGRDGQQSPPDTRPHCAIGPDCPTGVVRLEDLEARFRRMEAEVAVGRAVVEGTGRPPTIRCSGPIIRGWADLTCR